MSSKKDLAVSVRGLSKAYTIAHKQEKQSTLAETLLQKARNPFRRATKETFWALKDVSFDIRKGDVVGIIGRNGAGKSTLLKILSRITQPSRGRVNLYGRVGSLLEVGTGFHPELTGRENIYLNGQILGMRKKEIDRQFDAIVDFSGVEQFLDTAVKRYSSGMYVRLAFAVAAHLETEILIIDEVLAVGDGEFQKKCMGKMKDVSNHGRTVLFVSHNMSAMSELCNTGILLARGQVQAAGDLDKIIQQYLQGNSSDDNTPEWLRRDDGFDRKELVPLRMAVVNAERALAQLPLRNNQQYKIEIDVEVRQIDPALQIGYALYAGDMLLYHSFHTDRAIDEWPQLGVGKSRLSIDWPTRLLNEGQFRIELIAAINKIRWMLEPGGHSPSVKIEILGGLSDSPHLQSKRPGLLAPIFPWKISALT